MYDHYCFYCERYKNRKSSSAVVSAIILPYCFRLILFVYYLKYRCNLYPLAAVFKNMKM